MPCEGFYSCSNVILFCKQHSRCSRKKRRILQSVKFPKKPRNYLRYKQVQTRIIAQCKFGLFNPLQPPPVSSASAAPWHFENSEIPCEIPYEFLCETVKPGCFSSLRDCVPVSLDPPLVATSKPEGFKSDLEQRLRQSLDLSWRTAENVEPFGRSNSTCSCNASKYELMNAITIEPYIN